MVILLPLQVGLETLFAYLRFQTLLGLRLAAAEHGPTLTKESKMKKYIVLAIILFAAPAFAATATWTHDGLNTVGYTLYFWRTDTPATVWNKSVTGSTVRTMALDDNLFMPGTEYSFQMTAYNGVGESGRSATAKWTRPGYTPPGDTLPSSLYLKPTGVDQLIIQLTP
jgi:hypothetical protein